MNSKDYKQPVFQIVVFGNDNVVAASNGTDNVIGALGEWGDDWNGGGIK